MNVSFFKARPVALMRVVALIMAVVPFSALASSGYKAAVDSVTYLSLIHNSEPTRPY
jgi:hypothetical protein